MLSPNPFSLFCAVLLCLPLALVFTISSDSASSSAVTIAATVTDSLVILPSPPLIRPEPPKTPPRKILTNVPTPTNQHLHPPPPPPPNKEKISRPEEEDHDDVVLLKRASRVGPNPTRGPKKVAFNTPTPTSQLTLPAPPLPPPLPEDDDDDVDLLKRASRVSPNPTRGPKKVAFMFLTTTTLPFAPLWELFFNQSGSHHGVLYNVYIHADPMSKYDPPFTGVFSGRVIPSSKPTRRNTPTLITAARRLLAHALLDDPANYMFTLLSPSCVPLHSFNLTYNTLVGSTRSFIEVLSNETTAYGRWAARGEHVMLPEVGLDVFRIGSQFWSLTRRHARVVVEDVRLWRKFRLPCVTPSTCFPEENYFPTLLSMVDPLGVVPATLTNVNWRGRYDGHPHTYNGSVVGPELIRWLRESRPRYGDMGIKGSDLFVSQRWDPFLFARKFARNCVKPLMTLAKDVLFED